MKHKPNTGFEKKPKSKAKSKPKSHYIGKLFVANPKKVSFNEKLVKFLIYLALRLVIRPKKWKNPKKNYEIIDRTYKRIMSADFIFIPSSIAFYLIMAFMPIFSLIMFLFQFHVVQDLLTKGHIEIISPASPGHEAVTKWVVDENLLGSVLGKFIPGMSSLLDQMTDLTKADHKIHAGALTSTLISLIVSSWIAAGGFSKLVFTQSYMYEHKFLGGYWMNKIKGMMMVFIFSMLLFLALSVNIIVSQRIGASNMQDWAKEFFRNIFLMVGLFIGVFVGFILLFKFSPRYSIKIKHIIPGAMVSTIPTAGFLILFGMISSLWSYGNYGAIGAVMYLGMGSLLITYFIFVGLSANVAYYKTFVGDRVKNKWTFSKK